MHHHVARVTITGERISVSPPQGVRTHLQAVMLAQGDMSEYRSTTLPHERTVTAWDTWRCVCEAGERFHREAAATARPPRRFFRVEYTFRSRISGQESGGALVGPFDSPRAAVEQAPKGWGHVDNFTITEVWENFTDGRENIRLR